MRLNKLWIEAISKFPETVREELLKEAPHTRMAEEVPSEFKWLQPPESFVDFGFENLTLSKADKRAVMVAFAGSGIRIPGTRYKLRHDHAGYTVIETANGSELELPENWKQAVVVTSNNIPTWIGKLVRIGDQVVDDILSRYDYSSSADGWSLTSLIAFR